LLTKSRSSSSSNSLCEPACKTCILGYSSALHSILRGMLPFNAMVLFDIDGTLIRKAGPQHREALVAAVHRATGLTATLDHIPVQGMLDRDILTIMLRNAGASRALIRRQMPEIVKHAQETYARSCPNLESKVCPGVRALLARLHRRKVPMVLVTGNLTRIGWKKMEHAGLKDFFEFGAFAEMASSRTGLVRIAVQHARREGWIGRSTQVSLIGDHPNDVEAAKKNGVRSIAVATGIASAEELSRSNPDLLLTDLRDLRLPMLL
jgi:phosphoglycolate phosphatase